MDEFRIEKATIDDVYEIAEIFRRGWRSQGIIASMIDRTSPDDMRNLLAQMHRSRYESPTSIVFKMVETSSK